MLPGEPDPAVHLDRALAGGHRRVRAERLRRRRGEGSADVVLGDAPGREERERAAELELHQCRGERVRDRLVGADRLAELVALLREVDRELERPRPDAARLEGEGREGACPKLREQLGAREPSAGRTARHDAERPGHVVRLQHLALGPVELPDRVAADICDSRGGVEVGDERAARERPARLAAGHLGLQVARERGQHDGDRRPERRVRQGAPHLLEQDRLLEEAEPGASVLLRYRDPGPAELRELLPGRLFVGRQEGSRLGAQLLLLRRECEVHATSTSAGRARARQ